MRAVRDVMTTDVQAVRWDATAADAARQMSEHDVGALPVCDEAQRLRGIVTDRDITVRVVAAGLDPAVTPMRDLLDSGQLVAVGVDDDLETAVSAMKRFAVRRIPVIDGPRVVGMLSQADVAREVEADDAGRLVQSISEAQGNTAEGPA